MASGANDEKIKFWKWLVSQVGKTGYLEDPLGKAELAGFKRLDVKKYLVSLESSGNLIIKHEDIRNGSDVKKRIIKEILLINRKMDDDIAVNDIVAKSVELKNKVVLLVDVDNMLIYPKQTQEKILSVENLFYTALRYAREQGEIAWKQFFVSELSPKGATKFLYDQDAPVNIVPSRFNAADEEIERMVDFILSFCPDINLFVMAGNDSKLFKPLCKKIKAKGRKTYIITPGPSVGGIAGVADKTIPIFKLIARYNKNGKDDKNIQHPRIHRLNPFIFEALNLKNNALKIKTDNAREQFLFECLCVIRKHTSQKGSWLSFYLMVQIVWDQNLKEKWAQKCFKRADCINAIEALVAIELIDSKEREFKGETIRTFACPLPF